MLLEDMKPYFPQGINKYLLYSLKWHKQVKSVERTYKISELAESGILPCVNLNFILRFLPSHSKLFILMVASNLKTVTTINFLQYMLFSYQSLLQDM